MKKWPFYAKEAATLTLIEVFLLSRLHGHLGQQHSKAFHIRPHHEILFFDLYERPHPHLSLRIVRLVIPDLT